MSRWFISCAFLITLSVLAQNSSSGYQPGTIMNVVKHSSALGDRQTRYDVSVKVGNTIYTVLYTPPPGVNTAEYSAGLQLLVLVESDKLVFNTSVSGKTEAPILHRETTSSESGVDFSKAPSQYYSMKLKNLSEKLSLTEDQRTKIRPVLEQEAGELNYVWGNPALSEQEKLEKLESAVHTSDKRIRPLLTQAQREKLEAMRQQQKQELKERLEEQKAA